MPVDRVPPAYPVEPVAALPLAAEPPPLDPPEVCAKASEEPPTSKLKITAMWFIERPSSEEWLNELLLKWFRSGLGGIISM
jgi:hypothetical protein